MTAGAYRPPVRRLAAACAVLWVVALFTCSLHCTLGGLSLAANVTAHSCCAGNSPQKNNAPPEHAAKSGCHTFRDLTITDTAAPRADFVIHVFTSLDPAAFDPLAVAPVAIVLAPPPEPDVGPPAHLPVMRLAGRAPPALA